MIKKTIRLHPVQAKFCNSSALFRAFLGGRGSGKSTAGAWDLLKRALLHPGTYLVVGPTSGQLHDTSFATFKTLAQDLGVWKEWDASHQTVTLAHSQSKIRFRSADNPDRLRGPNLSGAWLDEASLMEQEALQIVQGALREFGKQGWMSATFTPQGITHWTYELFGSPKPDTEVFTSSTRENPFLPESFHARLEEQYGSTNFARQELEGAFVALEGSEWPPSYFENILYDRLPLHPNEIFCSIVALDPSMGKNAKTGDYSALVHLIADRSLNLWVDDSIMLRMTSNQCEDQTVSFLQQYSPGVFVCECNGFQEVLANNVLAKCTTASIPCPLSKYISTIDKEVRLRMMLTPYLAQHRLHLRRTPFNEHILAQFRDFPLGKHDDGIDAICLGAIAFHDLIGKAQKRTPPPPGRHRVQVR